MFRIDSANNESPKPAYTPIGTPGYFQDDDPSGGTWVTAEWLNHVQEEIAQLIEAMGGTLSKADDGQLADLIVPRLITAGHWTDTVEVGGTGIGGGTTVIDETSGNGRVSTDIIVATGTINGGTIGADTVTGALSLNTPGSVNAGLLKTVHGANKQIHYHSLDFSSVNLASGAVSPPFLVNNTTAVTGSRVQVWLEDLNGSAGLPVVAHVTKAVSGAFYFTLFNPDASAVDGADVRFAYVIWPPNV
jgi:hypothetical protein